MEEMEEALLRSRSSFPVHFRHVQLQREEDGAVGDAPTRRLHGRLH